MTNRDTPSATGNPVQIPSPDLARLPKAAGGLGSHELDAMSDDPAVLRQVIERARERLAFYESFDRIIGENIRRSGELMLETIALREEAQATEIARIARETEIEQARTAERERTHAMLLAFRDEVSTFQATTATLAEKIETALRELADSEAASTALLPEASSEPTSTQEDASLASPTAATRSDLTEPPTIDAAPASRSSFRPIRTTVSPAADDLPTSTELDQAEKPHTFDLVVNGISRATTALAFQRELATLTGILRVETREYAEGVLRLSLELANESAISDATFATWSGPGSISVVTRQPSLIALDFTED